MASQIAIYRIQIIMEWLKAGRPFTTKTMAAELDRSPRTIRDDIEYMKSMGIPIAFDFRRNTYVLTDDYVDLPYKALSGHEVATLLVASLALEALGDTPHAAVLAGVVERLRDSLPDSIRLEPAAISRMLRFEMGGSRDVSLEKLHALQRAVDERRVLTIRYRSNYRDEVTDRDVEPYSLLCWQGRWYLIAYCRLRRAKRDFRVDRILEHRLLEETFIIPPDFDLDAYLGPAFGMHRGERSYPVRVRFSAYQARWIREEVWHETQIFKQRKDGTLDVMMEVTGLNDVARWVLSYGGEAEVISPPVLRHRVAVEARRMAALYANDQPLPLESCD